MSRVKTESIVTAATIVSGLAVLTSLVGLGIALFKLIN